MASEESDEMPMLVGFARGASTGLELVANRFTSSAHTVTRAAQEHRYFSGPVQPTNSRFYSGPLQRNNIIITNSQTAGHATSASSHDGFYSGPIRLKNEASNSAAIRMPVSRPPRRRQHSIANEHLLRSGPLGKCDDPFCTTCPLYFDGPQLGTRPLQSLGQKVDPGFVGNLKKLFVDALCWGVASMPGVMNPHTKRVQQWNKFFLISCLLAVFVDPLFFFILSVDQNSRCIYFNLAFAKAITVLRSATDLVYFLHMLLQCRLAYMEPSSVGSGVLNDKPKEIIKHYLAGWFILDLVVVLPLPQITIWVIIPKVLGRAYAANFTKNLLRIIVLLQYIPRMIRFFPLLAGKSSTGFIFETAWSNFFINLLLFLLVAHVVGSCWYLFGLQRVNQCLRDACIKATLAGCDIRFLDCGDGGDATNRMRDINATTWDAWKNDPNATGCLSANSAVFSYGIYSSAVNVTFQKDIVPKYIYSLFWGFQQVSTLAGNQMPSVFIGEVLFVLGIVILGLLLTVLLIGNMQNFLLSLSRRRVDMQLRRHDVESWMARRHLPLRFRRKVRQVERFKWAANRGVNEEELLKSLPEDIEKEIRRALCLELIKKVRLFTYMEDQVLDAICQRLRQSLYIHGSVVLRKNYPIEKMHFFIKGNLQRKDENGTVQPFQNGFCGEELLTWCLETESQNPGVRRARNRHVMASHAISSTTVTCLGSVEAFSLSAVDLREVTRLYSNFLRNAKVQGALRYESLYWRTRAAITIQVAWRYFKRKQGDSTETIREAPVRKTDFEKSINHLS